MDVRVFAMMANALIDPVPQFDHATQTEVIIWGTCMSLAALFGGRAVFRSRRRWLLLVSFVFFFVGCTVSSREHMRGAMERLAEDKKQLDESERSRERDSGKAPQPAGDRK
jgi:hypothetical protein